MWSLYEAGLIQEATNTFWLNWSPIPSSITIGGVPQNAVRGEYIPQNLVKARDHWWSMMLTDFYIDGATTNPSTKNCISDTGTSLTYITETDYAPFKAMVMAASPDFICNSLVYDYCYTEANTCDFYWPNLKPISFFLEYNEYTMPPEAYTLSNGDLEGHLCSIAIGPIDDAMGMWILGDTVIRNFVTTYDYKNKQILMAINSNASANVFAMHNP